ncbi:ORF6N domain-containing protein [Cedecea sp.]|jgi:hypothetical protein|uniref:ORF6N domain-containing protein n=1 Tax=Cedecea sp. TaxID=1970739 RepID=UPI002F3F9E16
MTNHSPVESLPAVAFNGLPVITSELLAQVYGTERQRVTNNFNRNKERFVEGKHYFMAKGETLENLKNSLRGFHPITPNVRKLILWTERGAARHAKMLETDQAWDVFEKLEDCYFNKKNPTSLPPLPAKPNSYDTRTLCYKRAGVTVNELSLREDDLIISMESWLDLAKKNGWVVLRRDEAIVMLTEKIGGVMEEIFNGYTQAIHK